MRVRYLILTCLALVLSGCGDKPKVNKPVEQKPSIRLNNTVGYFCELYAPGDIAVEGFGIVAGLHGTGSAECPTVIREYIIKYIQQMLGDTNRLEAIRMLNSRDNAVVRLYGQIPAGSKKGEKFDLFVESFPNTQTTSLSGGNLYTCDLTSKARLGVAGAKILANGSGPVYIDYQSEGQDNLRRGVVIGGGQFLENNKLYLELKEPSYQLAAIIRDRINERFGEKTAVAKSAQIVDLTLPREFKDKYQKFGKLVNTLYLPENDNSEQMRVDILVKNLDNPMDDTIEYGLEAIGRPALKKIAPMLKHEKPSVRLRAARCMLNIGYENACNTLIELASPGSPYKVEAIKAIGDSNASISAKSQLRPFLSDPDYELRIMCYEYLSKASDLSIMPKLTSSGFRIDTILTQEKPLVYIRRNSSPRIVFFGMNIPLKKEIFLSIDNGNILINTAQGAESIMVLRQHPGMKEVIGPVYAKFKIEDLLEKLSDNSINPGGSRAGLGLGFTEIVKVVNKLNELGLIEADVVIGPMPIMPTTENTIEKLSN